MIPDQWYAVLDSKELPRKKPIGVTRFSEKLVFYRDSDGNPVCLFDRCCHRGASLSYGKVIGNHIQCPFHGLEYDSTGRCVVIPANGKNEPVPERYKVNAYPAREKHSFIWVWYGLPREEYPDVNFPEDLEGFTYSTLIDHWNAHYSRAIENQLDVVHLPFVHYNTIGRGNRALVNGPHVKIENNRIYIWVYNMVDEGQKPLKPEEIEARWPPMLHFHFPNTWMNRISDGTRVVAAFVPVDEENTLMYVRLYQNTVKIPVLRDVFNWVSRYGNRVILHQDRRVVQTQIPKASSLRMDEVLIQGDNPIVQYRKQRHELQESAGK
ncbi:aromatic ring-hydroxylating dioxygenase subunit alpha [Candidatus Bathyarchaeota archaeon]|nr:MAG: aromatic ring-hydroxylating dioxygenase subunit alpha [Candidatus Bathyarchaeota archaeon]